MTLLCERTAESVDLGSKELWKAVKNRVLFFIFDRSKYSKEYSKFC